jgi:hypothetical protein
MDKARPENRLCHAKVEVVGKEDSMADNDSRLTPAPADPATEDPSLDLSDAQLEECESLVATQMLEDHIQRSKLIDAKINLKAARKSLHQLQIYVEEAIAQIEEALK